MIYSFQHYYGDIVRYLFLAAAVIMIITLPLFSKEINFPVLFSVIGIAVLGVAAGLSNPKQFISSLINLIISLLGFIIFLYTATHTYQQSGVADKFVLTDIILSAIFLFAIYFSMKTLRAQMIGPNPPPPPENL
jgi:hypothetical protein